MVDDALSVVEARGTFVSLSFWMMQWKVGERGERREERERPLFGKAWKETGKRRSSCKKEKGIIK